MIARRTFLQGTIASGFVPVLPNAWSDMVDFDGADAGYIDAHVHVWTPDTASYPLAASYQKSDMVPASFTPRELFVHSKPEGVSKIVLIQMNFYEFDNRYMLDCIADHPGVFAGVGIVDERQSDVVEQMKLLREKGVKGFRLYASRKNAIGWQDSVGTNAMWREGADSGQCMCLLADPDALTHVHGMCERHPKTRVVIDHFARIGMKGGVNERDLDNLCRLASFDNVYVKTSAFYALGMKKAPYTDLGGMLQRLVREFGAKRLLWGSDCPYQVVEGHRYADSIGLIRDRLEFLNTQDKEWILRKTAESIYFE